MDATALPPFVVTIDGPAGSGKSTAARGLAARLGFLYLDTGAMYRAVALYLHRRGVSPDDGPAVEPHLHGLRVEAVGGAVVLNGEDVADAIRTPEVSQAASRVAVLSAVRRVLAAEQRRAAEGRRIVCEGRDQGTAVFPDAGAKFYLTADPAARAARRFRELALKGVRTTLDAVLAAQEERDARDINRPDDPLRPAADAVTIDTTILTPAEVLDRLEQEVARRCPTARP